MKNWLKTVKVPTGEVVEFYSTDIGVEITVNYKMILNSQVKVHHHNSSAVIKIFSQYEDLDKISIANTVTYLTYENGTLTIRKAKHFDWEKNSNVEYFLTNKEKVIDYLSDEDDETEWVMIDNEAKVEQAKEENDKQTKNLEKKFPESGKRNDEEAKINHDEIKNNKKEGNDSSQAYRELNMPSLLLPVVALPPRLKLDAKHYKSLVEWTEQAKLEPKKSNNNVDSKLTFFSQVKKMKKMTDKLEKSPAQLKQQVITLADQFIGQKQYFQQKVNRGDFIGKYNRPFRELLENFRQYKEAGEFDKNAVTQFLNATEKLERKGKLAKTLRLHIEVINLSKPNHVVALR